jgi:hypothetical protein
MNPTEVASAEPSTITTAPRRRFSWQRFGGKFLVISIAAHLLFGAVAAYLVVQTIQAKRKLTFQSGPKSPNASTRSLEHKVQMKKQKNALSAPPQAKRVTTTGIAKVALPDMPMMPSMSAALSPGAISGMGAAGLAPGGLGGGVGGMGGSGGAAINFFGARTSLPGLTGTFYDLKQTTNKQPTGMTPEKMETVMADFVRGGFNQGVFLPYFKAPKPLVATQMFTPIMDANLGPAAFQMEKEVQPKMWVIHYKGMVVPPEDGTYSFVGFGDDYLLVKFNGQLVLDGSLHPTSKWQPKARYQYPSPYNARTLGTAKGEAVNVRAGEAYPMEIVIAEQPGGSMVAELMVEKSGATYEKTESGDPILPIFRLANSAPVAGGKFLTHADTGPVWKAAPPEKGNFSVFSH